MRLLLLLLFYLCQTLILFLLLLRGLSEFTLMRRQSGKKSLRARVESGPQPQSNKAGTTFRAVPKIQLLLWLIMPHKLATGCQRSVAAYFRTFSMVYPILEEISKRTTNRNSEIQIWV